MNQDLYDTVMCSGQMSVSTEQRKVLETAVYLRGLDSGVSAWFSRLPEELQALIDALRDVMK